MAHTTGPWHYQEESDAYTHIVRGPENQFITAPNKGDAMKQLLQEARQEILDLRRRNEILTAQMGVVEVFASALGLKRVYEAMAPDVAWKLEKKINEINESGT